MELSDNIIYLAFCSSSSLSAAVAAGQIGKRAMVHVWDHPTKEALIIVHCAVDFGSSGKSLLSVGVDQRHSITMWCWTRSVVHEESMSCVCVFSTSLSISPCFAYVHVSIYPHVLTQLYSLMLNFILTWKLVIMILQYELGG